MSEVNENDIVPADCPAVQDLNCSKTRRIWLPKWHTFNIPDDKIPTGNVDIETLPMRRFDKWYKTDKPIIVPQYYMCDNGDMWFVTSRGLIGFKKAGSGEVVPKTSVQKVVNWRRAFAHPTFQDDSWCQSDDSCALLYFPYCGCDLDTGMQKDRKFESPRWNNFKPFYGDYMGFQDSLSTAIIYYKGKKIWHGEYDGNMYPTSFEEHIAKCVNNNYIPPSCSWSENSCWKADRDARVTQHYFDEVAYNRCACRNGTNCSEQASKEILCEYRPMPCGFRAWHYDDEHLIIPVHSGKSGYPDDSEFIQEVYDECVGNPDTDVELKGSVPQDEYDACQALPESERLDCIRKARKKRMCKDWATKPVYDTFRVFWKDTGVGEDCFDSIWKGNAYSFCGGRDILVLNTQVTGTAVAGYPITIIQRDRTVFMEYRSGSPTEQGDCHFCWGKEWVNGKEIYHLNYIYLRYGNNVNTTVKVFWCGELLGVNSAQARIDGEAARKEAMEQYVIDFPDATEEEIQAAGDTAYTEAANAANAHQYEIEKDEIEHLQQLNYVDQFNCCREVFSETRETGDPDILKVCDCAAGSGNGYIALSNQQTGDDFRLVTVYQMMGAIIDVNNKGDVQYNSCGSDCYSVKSDMFTLLWHTRTSNTTMIDVWEDGAFSLTGKYLSIAHFPQLVRVNVCCVITDEFTAIRSQSSSETYIRLTSYNDYPPTNGQTLQFGYVLGVEGLDEKVLLTHVGDQSLGTMNNRFRGYYSTFDFIFYQFPDWISIQANNNYFEGAWHDQFPIALDDAKAFLVRNGKVVDVVKQGGRFEVDISNFAYYNSDNDKQWGIFPYEYIKGCEQNSQMVYCADRQVSYSGEVWYYSSEPEFKMPAPFFETIHDIQYYNYGNYYWEGNSGICQQGDNRRDQWFYSCDTYNTVAEIGFLINQSDTCYANTPSRSFSPYVTLEESDEKPKAMSIFSADYFCAMNMGRHIQPLLRYRDWDEDGNLIFDLKLRRFASSLTNLIMIQYWKMPKIDAESKAIIGFWHWDEEGLYSTCCDPIMLPGTCFGPSKISVWEVTGKTRYLNASNLDASANNSTPVSYKLIDEITITQEEAGVSCDTVYPNGCTNCAYCYSQAVTSCAAHEGLGISLKAYLLMQKLGRKYCTTPNFQVCGDFLTIQYIGKCYQNKNYVFVKWKGQLLEVAPNKYADTDDFEGLAIDANVYRHSINCCTFGNNNRKSNFIIVSIGMKDDDSATPYFTHLLYYKTQYIKSFGSSNFKMQCCDDYLLLTVNNYSYIYFGTEMVFETDQLAKVHHQPPKSAIAEMYGVEEDFIRGLQSGNGINTWCCKENEDSEQSYFIVEFVDRYLVPNKQDINPCQPEPMREGGNNVDYVYRPNPFNDRALQRWMPNRWDAQNQPKCVMVWWNGINLTENNCATPTEKEDGSFYTDQEKNDLIDEFYLNKLEGEIDPRDIVTEAEAEFKKHYVYYDDIFTSYSYDTATPHDLPTETVLGQPQCGGGNLMFCANNVYWLFDKDAGLMKFDALTLCPIG